MSLFNIRWREDDAVARERKLISAAQRGERQAFEALKHTYEQALSRFIARRVGISVAEDVAQETWVAAWQSVAKWDGRARFKAWLYAIAEHKCVDHHRARSKEVHSLDSSLLADVPSRGIDQFAASELRETILVQLASLPQYQREVVELYYYEELTLPEIAAMLKRNLNTVKYQFYRAHARVGAALAEQHPTYADKGKLGSSHKL